MTPSPINAQVQDVTPLTNRILQLRIQPDAYQPYEAGQYLEIKVDNQWQPYSIANAPLGSPYYELHVRHYQKNPYDEPLFAQIKKLGTLSIRLPFGQCTFANLKPKKPILFIVGGTGLAPAKAMIEQLLATDDDRPYNLWWAARSESDLYLDDKLQEWQQHVPHFSYHPFLAEQHSDSMVEAIIKFYQQPLNKHQLVFAGPFDMVYKARDRLVKHGVASQAMMADAFDFEEKL